MQIQDCSHVTISFTLTLDNGEIIDSATSEEPLAFIFGKQQIWPAVEARLSGMEAGEKVDFVVAAKDGFGEPKPEMVQEIPRSEFPAEVTLEEGMVFKAESDGVPLVFEVKSVTDEVVRADFNHPLAGKDLHFDIEVIEAREATADELKAAEHHCEHGSCHECSEHE